MARNPSHVAIIQFAPNYLAFSRAKIVDNTVSDLTSGVDVGDWNPNDGSLARALADFVRRNGLTNDRLHLVIARHEVAVRILELPAHDAEEIRGMVHLSAEEIVPFPLSELLTAHTILESLPDGASRVLAVVVRKIVVESALDVVAAAGLRIEQVLLSTSCLLTALRNVALPEVAAVLHVSPDGFEACLMRDNGLVFSRGIAQSVAGAPGELAPEAVDEIVAELRSSFAAYRRDSQDGARAEEIVVSAGGLDASPLLDSLKSAFDLPVRASGDLVAQGAFAGIAGDRTFQISLLPEAELKRRAAAGTRLRLFRYAAAAAVALVASLAVYAQMTLQRNSYIDELDTRAEELRPGARTLIAKRQQLRIIEEHVDRSLSPLRALAEFADIAPAQGVNFSRLSFDRSDDIVLAGSATDPKLFDQVIDNIRSQGADSFPQFARAREMYRQVRAERGKQVWDFAVTIPLGDAAAQ